MLERKDKYNNGIKNEMSKKYIAEALIQLMKKKDFTEITNKDITDKARLSHITIYRNFNSKDEFDKIFLNKAKNKKEQYNYYFVSGELYNIYYIWLIHGCKESPEKLSDMFMDFFIIKGNNT